MAQWLWQNRTGAWHLFSNLRRCQAPLPSAIPKALHTIEIHNWYRTSDRRPLFRGTTYFSRHCGRKPDKWHSDFDKTEECYKSSLTFFSNLDFVTFWLVLKFFSSEQKRQVVKHHYITFFHWLDSSDQKSNIIRIKSPTDRVVVLAKWIWWSFQCSTKFQPFFKSNTFLWPSLFFFVIQFKSFLFCWFWIQNSLMVVLQ